MHPQKPLLRPYACLPLMALLLGLAGCKDREIRTYRTPKEAEDAVAQAPASPVAAPSVAQAPERPQWQTPGLWKEQQATGMRFASFTVSDGNGASADISIVNFAGSGGDELANVNRWRSQVKLPPIGAEALPSQVETLSAEAGDFSVVDLNADQAEAGKPPARLLGAWLHRNGKVWFFKVMGPAELVGAQKDTFVQFLRSVKFPGAGTPATGGGAAANTNDLPKVTPAGPDLSNMPTNPTLSAEATLKAASGSILLWNAPPAWTVKAASSMRKGSYALGAGGAVDLSITAFPGDVGGPIANVNRWLGQVGLPPIEEAALPQYTSHMEANGLVFFIADTGSKEPSNPQRILAAVVFWQGNSWFFKMTGPTELVAQERPGFLEFLHTVHTP